MNPYQAEKIASQHRDELRALGARCGRARQARRARGSGQPREAALSGWPSGPGEPSGQAPGYRGPRHPLRRRAGWALVALGLRLAYAAGED